MPKFALIQQLSFNLINDNKKIDAHTSIPDNFFDLKIRDNVKFYEFKNSTDMFTSMHEFFGKSMLEVINCDYDDKVLLQAVYLQNTTAEVHKNIIVVKRQILNNDTYTFAEYNEVLNIDPYVYLDVEENDIVNILKHKCVNHGIILKSNKTIKNLEYSDDHDTHTHTGILKVNYENNKHNIKYLNIHGMANTTNEDSSSDEFQKKIETAVNKYEIGYLYNQVDFSIGLLNCYYQMLGTEKNEIMSEILNADVYGDVIIGLENYLNDDNRILKLDDKLFCLILNFIKEKNYNAKNQNFFNIYYELKN